MTRSGRSSSASVTAWMSTLAGLSLVASFACTQEPEGELASGRRAFIERLGSDTMSIEVYTRTPDGFRGDLIIRSPVTRVAHYEATLGADGMIERMEVDWRTPAENPEGPAPDGFTLTVEGDSATLERRGGRSPGTSRIAAPGDLIPVVGKTPVAFAVLEQAVRQAMAAEADSYPVAFFSSSRGRVMPNAIVRYATDSVSMSFFGNPLVAAVDDEGRVLGRSGRRTTLKMEGEPVTDVDFEALAADFAARDARGEGMGVASPTETMEATLGGANVQVVYSRPAVRGRVIWGGLVPWNEVWRTGANAATEFSTDRDLEIGGVQVPAGTYTLYSVYTPESAQLIINQQTGQWGTEYHADRDLARVELSRQSIAAPVERFTIGFEPREGGGVIQLSWDRARYSVPLVVR